MSRFLLIILLSLTVTLPQVNTVLAQENRISIRGSNLEIPRFVTLKKGLVNMRTGPGKKYPIIWQYQRRHLPMKVIGEFDVWRKVVDHEGITGWMHVSTLSVKRMALIADTTVKIHTTDDPDSRVRAVAEQGVLVELETCAGGWCKVSTDDISGWVRRPAIWGLLEGESFGQP